MEENKVEVAHFFVFTFHSLILSLFLNSSENEERENPFVSLPFLKTLLVFPKVFSLRLFLVFLYFFSMSALFIFLSSIVFRTFIFILFCHFPFTMSPIYIYSLPLLSASFSFSFYFLLTTLTFLNSTFSSPCYSLAHHSI